MDINTCLEKGYLLKEIPSLDLIKKEINEAAYDMERAKKAIDDADHKWAIVKSYYAMFHMAKAVGFQCGYREKKHVAVLVILEHLSKEGKLEERYVNDFRAAMAAREGADYRYAYSTESAAQMVAMAQEFCGRTEQLLR